MLGFSFRLLCREGSDTEATRGWTEGKPWEMAWGSSVGKEHYASDERVDGGETVGNSLGRALGNSLWRAPLGRSGMEASTRWTDGKQWEIAWGSSVGRKRHTEKQSCWHGFSGQIPSM